MACKAGQAAQVEHWQRVTTVEDHLADGGFGSWLAEALASAPNLRTRIAGKALDPRVCDVVASQSTLNVLGGLVP